jgi:arginase family enzyme
VRRGAIPFVLGGSSELCAGVAAGLMSAVGGVMGVVNINSQLDVRDQLVRTLVQYIAFGFTF